MTTEEEKIVSLSLELNTGAAEINLRKCLTLLSKTMRLVQELGGGDPDVRNLIMTINRAIMVLNQFRLTVIAVQAAAGPVGWALAGVSLALTTLTTAEFVEDTFYDATRG